MYSIFIGHHDKKEKFRLMVHTFIFYESYFYPINNLLKITHVKIYQSTRKKHLGKMIVKIFRHQFGCELLGKKVPCFMSHNNHSPHIQRQS